MQGIAITQNLQYAFVADWRLPSFNVLTELAREADREAGAKVGVIRDPFGSTPELLGVTTPIPFGFAASLALSPDGKLLYAGYRGAEAFLVFDVSELIRAATEAPEDMRDRVPLDQIDQNEDGFQDYPMNLSPLGTTGQPVALASVPLPRFFLEVTGKFGDIIEINLDELLSASELDAVDADLFFLTETSFRGGKLATYEIDGDTTLVQSTSTLTDPGTDFENTGTFFFVPDIDSNRVRRGESLASMTAFGGFYFGIGAGAGAQQNDSMQFFNGIIKIALTDGDDDELGYTDFGLVGTVGKNTDPNIPANQRDEGVNHPLDVYRVQQRLKYFGFPGSRGEVIDVNGDIDKQVATSAFQPRPTNWNAPYTWPTTEAATRLFQAAIAEMDATMNQPIARNVSATRSITADADALVRPRDPNLVGPPVPNTLMWLNADNAPRWVELHDDGPGTPPSATPFAVTGGDYDILPGANANGNRDGQTGQLELYATSWVADIIRRATADTAASTSSVRIRSVASSPSSSTRLRRPEPSSASAIRPTSATRPGASPVATPSRSASAVSAR